MLSLMRSWAALSFVPFFLAASFTEKQKEAPSAYQLQPVMIPMRDGVRLETVIMRPLKQTEPLPILLQRTPYGVPDKPFPEPVPAQFSDLAHDGYIFVFQNLRGRFKSEGTFLLSSYIDLTDSKATNETTDGYDTVDWLVKNVDRNNGRVGIFGVSYVGLTAAQTLLKPHPALKAISEQASPADQWMNDDMHRYGALRESYALEYSVLEQADKNANTHFAFNKYDTFDWYLHLGPLSNVNADYLLGKIPFWNSIVEHPNYDAFWKKEAWVNQVHSASVPNLNVAGFWDQEDPWGPWQIFENAKANDPNHQNFMVAGPWFHGQWRSTAEKIGIIPFGGHATGKEFRANIEAPFFRYYLHGGGAKFEWTASTFQTGSNTWKTYSSWPPSGSQLTNLYLHGDGTLSWDAPGAEDSSPKFVDYVSDPAKPVPYRQRPISPTYPGADWRTWEAADQRFVDGRPDVLTFETGPLDKDVIVTGALKAELYASSSGTDSDFIVKLIDVYSEDAQKDNWDKEQGPKPGQFAESLNGYELPIAMEVRRGRFNESFESPQPLAPNKPVLWSIPLRDHDHVFLKGHRIMVQIQSSWFPAIDRNPQRYTDSIYTAAGSDFQKATQRVYCSPDRPSRLVLPLMGPVE